MFRLTVLPNQRERLQLGQNTGEQISTEISSMGIWNADADRFRRHELVLTARVRSIEAKLAQAHDKLITPDWSERGH
jgi:hypothetical protein